MRRLALPAILCFGAFGIASSQSAFRLDGYAVNIPSYQHLRLELAQRSSGNQHLFVDITRLRLRPSVGLWQDGFLMLEYEMNSTYSSSALPFQHAATRNPKQLVDLTWNPVHNSHWSVVHYVDRLYFRQITSIGDFTIGRQRISWGTGRIWNPTDLFNPLNPTSYSKIEKDGIDGLLTKLRLGDFSDFSLVYNTKERLKKSNFGFRFRSNASGFDYSLMGGSFDDRAVVGADFAGSVFDAGIRAEGIVSGEQRPFRKNFVKYVVGLDNQFSERLYALLEYHFNGEGKASRDEYEISRLVSGDLLNMGRQFLTAQVSNLVHPLVTVLVTVTSSFTDGSGFVGGAVVYSAADEITLSAGGQYFFGDSFDEYWYYASSAYLKLDFFF